MMQTLNPCYNSFGNIFDNSNVSFNNVSANKLSIFKQLDVCGVTNLNKVFIDQIALKDCNHPEPGTLIVANQQHKFTCFPPSGVLGDVLTISHHGIEWLPPTSVDSCTAFGSIPVGTGISTICLLPGDEGQFLSIVGGTPTWVDNPGIVCTDDQYLTIGAGGGGVTCLPPGNENQVLTIAPGGNIAWLDVGPGGDVCTGDQQLTVGNGMGSTTCLNPGSIGELLSVNALSQLEYVDQTVLANGSAASPTYSFLSNPTLGMYRVGANTMGFSSDSALSMSISNTQVESALPIRIPNGTVTAPSIAFSSNTTTGIFTSTGGSNIAFSVLNGTRFNLSNTAAIFLVPVSGINGSAIQPGFGFSGGNGMYVSAANTVSFATNATLRFSISTTLVTSTLPFQGPAGLVGTPTFSFSGDPNTGMYSAGADILGFSTNGANRLSISTTAITPTLPILGINGSSAAPSYSFTNDPDTGMYLAGTNTIGFATDGIEQVTISDTAITFNLPVVLASIQVGDGSNINPSYSFTNDTNTGLYLAGTDTIGFTTDGGLRMSISDTSITFFLPISLGSIRVGDGSAAAPSYSFTNDTNTGFYLVGSDTLGFSTNGTQRMSISTSNINKSIPLYAESGAANTPSYSFFSDISTGMYLSSAGVLGLTAGGSDSMLLSGTQISCFLPVRVGNGGASVPTFSFLTDTDTGLYRAAVNTLGFTTAGTLRMSISDTAISFFLPIAFSSIQVGDGSESAPSYSFTNDPNTGLYLVGTNTIGFTTNSTLKMYIDTASVTSILPIQGENGSATTPSYSFTSDPNTGLYSVGADTIGFSTGGTLRMSISDTAISFLLPIAFTGIQVGDGSAAAPSYSFTNDTNTGLYLAGTDTIGFTTDGVLRMSISDTAITFNLPISLASIQVGDGSAAAPSYSFTSDPNTGFYSAGADSIGFSTNGTNRLTLNTSTLTSTLPIVAPNGGIGNLSYRFATANVGIYLASGDAIAFYQGGTIRGQFYSGGLDLTGVTSVNNGTAAAPSYTFGNDFTIGMYLAASNTLGFSTDGTLRMTISDTAITFLLPIAFTSIQVGDGSAATPSYSFTNDTNTGFYLANTDTIGFSTGGTLRLSLSTTELTSTLPIFIPDGLDSAPSLAFTNDPDTGIYLSGTNQLGISSNGTDALLVGPDYIYSQLPIMNISGTATDPSYTFDADSNTGIYSSAADTINFTTGGTSRVALGTTTLTKTVPILAENGTNSAPSYSFSGATSTGLYSDMADRVYFALQGTTSYTFVNTGLFASNARAFFSDGTAVNPTYTFTTGQTNGMYYATTNTLGFSTDGTSRMTISTTAITFNLPITLTSIQVGDGSAAAPSYSFTNDTNTGLYLAGTDTIGLSAGGTLRLSLSTTALTSTVPILGPDGSNSNPTYSFTNDTDMGIYRSASNTLGFATDGVLRMTISDTAISFLLPIAFTSIQVGDGSAAAPSYSFTNDPDTGLYLAGTDTIGFTTDGTLRLSISDTDVTFTLPILAANGAAANPSYSFSTDDTTGFYLFNPAEIAISLGGTDVVVIDASYITSTAAFSAPGGTAANPAYVFATNLNTGIYSSATDSINFSISSNEKLNIQTSNITSVIPILAPLGSNSLPSYSFSGDPNTGIYSSTADTINFTTGGTSRMSISTTAITLNLPISLVSILVGDGSAAAPSYSFTNDIDTGLYLSGTNTIGFATDGTLRMTISDTAIAFLLPISFASIQIGDGSAATPSLAFTNDTDTGLYLSGTNQTGISSNGTGVLLVGPDYIYSQLPIMNISGTATDPSYTFDADSNTGMYSSGADTINFTTGGTSRLSISTTAITLNLPLSLTSLQVGNGSAASPSYSFTNSTSTGLFLNSSNIIGVSTGGTERMTISTTVLQSILPFQIGNGTAAAPSYSFSGDVNTGVYRSATDTLAFSTNGTLRMSISTSVVTNTLPILNPDGSSSAPSYSFSTDSTTGLYMISSGNLGITCGSTDVIACSSTNIDTLVPINALLGSASAPSYSFFGDDNTGIYSSAADTMNFSTGGTSRVSISTTAITFNLPITFTSIQVGDGSAAAPSYSFTNETDCGFYLAGTNSIGVSTNGVLRMSISDANVNVSNILYLSNGTNSAPSYSFTNDTDTGFYLAGTNQIGVASNGTGVVLIGPTFLYTQLPITITTGSATNPSYTFDLDTNTGIYSSGANIINFTTGGTNRLEITTSGIVSTLPIQVPLGTATDPTFSFVGDTNTGIYSSGADSINITTGGTLRFAITTGAIFPSLPIRSNSDGSNSAPIYSFTNSSNSGMYLSGTNTLGFSTNGTLCLSLSTTSLTNTLPYYGPNGSAAVPTFTFASDPDTGISGNGSNTLVISTGGTARYTISSTATTLSAPMRANTGSAAAPSFSFSAQTTMGMYDGGTNTLGFSTNSTLRLSIGTAAVTSTLPILVPAGTNSAPGLAFSGDADTGIYSSAADNLDVTVGGTNVMNAYSGGVTIPSQITALPQTWYISNTPTVLTAMRILSTDSTQNQFSRVTVPVNFVITHYVLIHDNDGSASNAFDLSLTNVSTTIVVTATSPTIGLDDSVTGAFSAPLVVDAGQLIGLQARSTNGSSTDEIEVFLHGYVDYI